MKTLLIIFVSLIVLNLLSRIFLRRFGPRLLQWYIQKKMKVPGTDNRRAPDFTPPASAKPKEDKGNEGEYIDFEEID